MALDPFPALFELSEALVRPFRLSLDPYEATLDASAALARLSGALGNLSEASLKPFGVSSRASSRTLPLLDLPLYRKVAQSAGINLGDLMDCSGRGNRTWKGQHGQQTKALARIQTRDKVAFRLISRACADLPHRWRGLSARFEEHLCEAFGYPPLELECRNLTVEARD